MRKINIGLTDEQRQGVCELLNRDLSDAYLLLIKTKKYHWDVVGPQFRSLHELWEEQYQTLTASIDSMAERIRALGSYPVGTAKGFLEMASIQEAAGTIPRATEMVAQLVEDHEQIIRNLREHIDACSEQFHDEGTADFLTGLMEGHEEMAWMLRSFIEGEALQADGSEAKQEASKIPASV
ncbi:DNA starvation/stationary phase protection protein [Candidatus Gracilibacteria bacterium]|jgi:starvation-inducible DNA-binding protein|nr:DNA starvation/stationary phase protection protein [Candidatus Gracilibacteria bacterium]NJM88952.1 DNA starvation/stationary phase protection protein [Hydrococcus sp. RU_2_2]NJP20416.1 DNA starvation/stationary phase protection protein [Hydrococcus sp. CRU_1_1]NJQ96944.1 DNA starvation/stationary phase protection protein [Hydrococcus sp. CSU_1_8]